jgi:uncharacterized protein with PIN domain
MADREKVINQIEVDIQRAERTGEMLVYVGQKTAKDALALLKEQEGIVPYIDIDEAKCPDCKVKLTRQELLGDDVLFEDFFDYCPHCGKPVLWEGR